MNQIIIHLEDVSLHRDKQQTYFSHLYKSTFKNVRSLLRVLPLEDYICWSLRPGTCHFLQNIAKIVTSATKQTIQYIYHTCSFLIFLKDGLNSAIIASLLKNGLLIPSNLGKSVQHDMTIIIKI